MAATCSKYTLDENEGSEAESEASIASSSQSENAERCAICLSRFKEQDTGNPDSCEHVYCLECIQAWSMKTNTCPIDRISFREILVRHPSDTKVCQRLKVQSQHQQDPGIHNDDLTFCEVCGRSDREDRMLLCDGCDDGFHCECLTPALEHVPAGRWFCPRCENDDETEQAVHLSPIQLRSRGYRQVARTGFSERIRREINDTRVQRGAFILISETESEVDDEELMPDDYEEEVEEALVETPSAPTKRKATRRSMKRPKRKRRRLVKRRTLKKKKKAGRRKAKGAKSTPKDRIVKSMGEWHKAQLSERQASVNPVNVGAVWGAGSSSVFDSSGRVFHLVNSDDLDSEVADSTVSLSNKISSLTNLNEKTAANSQEDSFEEILRKQRVFLSNNWYDQVERKRDGTIVLKRDQETNQRKNPKNSIQAQSSSIIQRQMSNIENNIAEAASKPQSIAKEVPKSQLSSTLAHTKPIDKRSHQSSPKRDSASRSHQQRHQSSSHHSNSHYSRSHSKERDRERYHHSGNTSTHSRRSSSPRAKHSSSSKHRNSSSHNSSIKRDTKASGENECVANASRLIDEIVNSEKVQKIVMDSNKQPKIQPGRSERNSQLITQNGDNYTSEDMEEGFEEIDEPYDPESDLHATDLTGNSLNLSAESVGHGAAPLKSKNSGTKADTDTKKREIEGKIINAAKNAIRSFYIGKQINKDEYKNIMKKVVNKCLKHSKSHEIKEDKVAKLVVDYVKVTKSLRKQSA